MSEIGGDFHWVGPFEGQYLEFPEPHNYFSTGRAIVLSIARLNLRNRLWIPTYFCPHTVDYWSSCGLVILRYVDHPVLPQPDFSGIAAEPGDMVLAVNLFGIRKSQPWREWAEANVDNRKLLLIEDHSHDPLSNWALESHADYVFSSLRKTVPLPDGAIVWSPRGHVLPAEPKSERWAGSAKKLAAMIWKSQFLSGGEVDTHLKSFFRQMQIDGEAELARYPAGRISPWSRQLMSSGIPNEWRLQRASNVRSLIDGCPISPQFKPLFYVWPEGHCPFNFMLLTADQSVRDRLRAFLITQNIYTPIHWIMPESTPQDEAGISHRLLTIPADQRYGQKDVERILEVLGTYD